MYCTKQDLIDRFGEHELIELTDNDGSGFIDDTHITRVLADIDGLIDGYLASRYELPLTEIPKSLVRIGCDLARYDLYDSATDQVIARYNNAIAWLRDVASGKASLGVNADGSEPKVADNASMQTSGNVFNRDDDGFI